MNGVKWGVKGWGGVGIGDDGVALLMFEETKQVIFQSNEISSIRNCTFLKD